MKTVKVGSYEIEVRKYQAGSGSRASDFCDYWIKFRGAPADRAIGLKLGFDLNDYNSCGALLALDKSEYLFVVGAYMDSQGNYVPVFFGEREGELTISNRRDCALNSSHEGHEQAWKGWTVTNDHALICNEEWRVLSLPQ